MFDHDDGGARQLCCGCDSVTDLDHAGRVEVGRGFVEQDQTRIHREDARERQPLLLSTRQLGSTLLDRKIQPHRAQRVVHAWPDLRAGYSEVLHAECHVVADAGQDHLRVGILQHHADASALLTRTCVVDQDSAGLLALIRTAQQTGHAVQQCRFPRSRRAQQQYPLTGSDREVQIAYRPTTLPGMLPAPAFRSDPGAHRAHCGAELGTALPESNRLNAPVFASALTTYHDSTPAMTVPETIADTV